jgi:hypothetical protein
LLVTSNHATTGCATSATPDQNEHIVTIQSPVVILVTLRSHVKQAPALALVERLVEHSPTRRATGGPWPNALSCRAKTDQSGALDESLLMSLVHQEAKSNRSGAMGTYLLVHHFPKGYQGSHETAAAATNWFQQLEPNLAGRTTPAAELRRLGDPGADPVPSAYEVITATTWRGRWTWQKRGRWSPAAEESRCRAARTGAVARRARSPCEPGRVAQNPARAGVDNGKIQATGIDRPSMSSGERVAPIPVSTSL